MATDPDPWLNSTKAAEYLGYTPGYLRRLVYLNRIRYEKRGTDEQRGRLYFRQSWLDDYRARLASGTLNRDEGGS